MSKRKRDDSSDSESESESEAESESESSSASESEQEEEPKPKKNKAPPAKKQKVEKKTETKDVESKKAAKPKVSAADKAKAKKQFAETCEAISKGQGDLAAHLEFIVKNAPRGSSKAVAKAAALLKPVQAKRDSYAKFLTKIATAKTMGEVKELSDSALTDTGILSGTAEGGAGGKGGRAAAPLGGKGGRNAPLLSEDQMLRTLSTLVEKHGLDPRDLDLAYCLGQHGVTGKGLNIDEFKEKKCKQCKNRLACTVLVPCGCVGRLCMGCAQKAVAEGNKFDCKCKALLNKGVGCTCKDFPRCACGYPSIVRDYHHALPFNPTYGDAYYTHVMRVIKGARVEAVKKPNKS